jgi:Prasinovirus endonuclease VII
MTTLTPVQQVILYCLFVAPEDPRGFEKLRDRETGRRYLARNPGKAAERKRKWRAKNLERARLYNKEYGAANSEQRRKNLRQWRAANPERYLETTRRGKAKNSEHIRKSKRDYAARTRRENLAVRLLDCCRHRVWKAMRGIGEKSVRTIELLGCSIPELRNHLEKQFKPGMTWENYGPVWHIDHHKPCAKFDFADPAQQRECFHFSNLQPLFAGENLKKGDKYDFSK